MSKCFPFSHRSHTLGKSCGRQTADVCRQLSILPTEVGCLRGAHGKQCLPVHRVIDATGSGYFYAICYSKASHCSLSVLTPSHYPVLESQSYCFYQESVVRNLQTIVICRISSFSLVFNAKFKHLETS